MISFIIPAHNEAAHLGGTLRAIVDAASGVEESYEMIVVDDASHDQTGDIAAAHGARVIRVEYRQISATRNAGARAATGSIFFFIDALQALRHGAVAGGCLFRFDGWVPLWARLIYRPGVLLARCIKLVGGCCLFCRRDAFTTAQGFSEDHYAGEEIGLIRAWKRQGKFVIPSPTVITSGRKLRHYSLREIIVAVARAGWRQYFPGRQRVGFDLWYGERRPDPLAPTCDAHN